MRILNLKIKNYKGVKEIEITPNEDSDLLEITGDNGEWKSSVIEAIWDTLQHSEARKQNSNPIRNGQEKAEVEIDFGDYQIERTFTQKGTYLKLKDKEWKLWSPQNRIDAWLWDITFDPSKFLKMSNKDRIETLLKVGWVQEKVAEIEGKKDELYEERRMIGRDGKNLKGTLENYSKEVAHIKVNKVDTKQLKEKLKEIEKIEDEKKENENKYKDNEKLISNKKEKIKENNNEIERLKAKIKEIENKNIENKEDIKEAKDKNKELTEKIEAKKEELKEKDKEKIWNKIDKAEEINEKYRKKKEYDEVYKNYINKQEEYKAMTAKIKELREQKRELINKVDLGKEINVEDKTLYIDSIPFDQINKAEKIKTSLKIGSLANSKIKVMRLQDWNDLDKQNMKILKDFAKENDYQIWVERIINSGEWDDIKIKGWEIE